MADKTIHAVPVCSPTTGQSQCVCVIDLGLPGKEVLFRGSPASLSLLWCNRGYRGYMTELKYLFSFWPV